MNNPRLLLVRPAFFSIGLIAVLLLPCLKSFGQSKPEPPLTRILFVFDCSLSMSKRWEGSTNMDISKRVLNSAIDSLSRLKNVQVALRMYGHQNAVQPNRNCKDTRLEVPFSAGNWGSLRQKIREAQPKGTTPIAYTLEQCGADFPACSNCRNIIVLITDGVEECDGDPCAVSAALQSKGIVLRPFVIGVGLDENFKKTFDCVGKFFDATSERSFKTAMGVIISQALNSTTAQVNLLDTYGKPTETNATLSFYDDKTGVMKYHYMHTLNHRGNPDTIPLDPLSTYRMVVHTVPPVEKTGIELTPGKHTLIAVDAPQGSVLLKASTTDYKGLKGILRKKGEKETLVVLEADRGQRLLTGKYDLEVLSLPRVLIPDVEVSQSKTTTIQIPDPGIANVQMNAPGYGQLLLVEKNKTKWLYDLNENFTRENIVLQPGNYMIVFRSKSAKETIYSITREFRIESGQGTQVKLF
jgi:Ca-activated chloride channel family protein